MGGVLDRPPRDRRPSTEPAGDRLPSARYTVRPEAVETVEAPEKVEYEAPMFGQPAARWFRNMPRIRIHGARFRGPSLQWWRRRWCWLYWGCGFWVPQLHVTEPLSLAVIERDGQVQIQWNHASQSVMGAASGTLDIVDGGEKRSIPLNRTELAQGGFTYMRRSGDVEVRLSVTTSGGGRLEEASRFLGTAPEGADASEVDAMKVERDALQDEVTRLRGQTGQQAARIQQLERTLVILQSRLGITAGR